MADPVLHTGIAPRQAVLTLLPPKGAGSGNMGLLHQSYMPTC